MAQRQTVLNIAANIFSFFVGVGISFFLTPYLVDALGSEAYGFYPMASYFFSYTTIITSALNNLAGRFIAIEIHKGNIERATSYFNTVLFMDIIIAVVLVILSLVVTIQLDTFLDIPDPLVQSTKFLFFLVFVGNIFNLVFSVYITPMFVKNRVDLQALTKIMSNTIRVLLTVLLFAVLPPDIVYLGIIFVCHSIAAMLFTVSLKKRLLPNIKVSIHEFNTKTLLILLKSGGWISLSQLNNSLLVGLDLIIANVFLGAAAAGTLAIAKTIPSLTVTFSTAIASALIPNLVKSYALDKSRLTAEIKKTFIILSIINPIIVGIFISVGHDFYKLWIPSENATTLYILSILTMLPAISISGVSTIEHSFMITDNLKMNALVSFFTAAASISIVMIILSTHSPIGLYAIASVSAFFEVGKYIFFVPVYAAKYSNSKWYTFYSDYLKSWLCVLVTILIGFLLRSVLIIDSWQMLVVVALLASVFAFSINATIVTNKDIRRSLRTMTG